VDKPSVQPLATPERRAYWLETLRIAPGSTPDETDNRIQFRLLCGLVGVFTEASVGEYMDRVRRYGFTDDQLHQAMVTTYRAMKDVYPLEAVTQVVRPTPEGGLLYDARRNWKTYPSALQA
jgi:hypothetical protein